VFVVYLLLTLEGLKAMRGGLISGVLESGGTPDSREDSSCENELSSKYT
jgi:hypothetical protein